jgi:hypothetical protein
VLKKIRLTRSIFVDGEPLEKGSVRYLAQPLADDLVSQGSAVHLNFFGRFFSRILFLFRRSDEKKRGTERWIEEPKKQSNWSNDHKLSN